MTENDIRPEELLGEQARLFAEDVARLMRHRDDFVPRNRPACSFVTCDDCGTTFANPCLQLAHLEEHYWTSQNYEFWSKYIFPESEATRVGSSSLRAQTSVRLRCD
jgi:hypothetical protein